jgi:Fic family protein
VGFEEHVWRAEPDGMTGRARLAAGSGPYRSAVPARLAGYAPALPADLAADVEEAAAALARFDAHVGSALGVDGPTLGPMQSVLLRTESVSSSRIENLTVGARQLALEEVGQGTASNAAVVVANVHAMRAAVDLADRLDAAAILAMHRALLGAQPGWEDRAGRWRDGLVWIGATSVTPRGAAYVAPAAALVPDAVEDLVGFMRRDDLPVLAQAAVAHAQFETIHPFGDGNGRTGRALVQALLRGKGLTRVITPPVSAGLLVQVEAYVEALRAFRAGDARPIVERFADAARFASTSGAELVDALAREVDAARAKLAALRPQATAWKVLPLLVSQPVLTTRFLGERLGLTTTAAIRALDQLAAAGVVEERTGRRRGRVWQHAGLLRIFDAYAAQSRRP